MSLSSNRLRVGIIMGGRSIEREVSFNSGRTVYDHINTELYNPVVIFQRVDGNLFLLPIHFMYRGKITDFERRLDSEAQKITWDQLPHLIDFMYIATHGQFAEDGRLQGFLEILGIPYLGAGVGASAFRMNKIKHKQLLSAAGISVPPFFPVCPFEIMNDALLQETVFSMQQIIAGPWIVKPAHEGSSLGVFVIENEEMMFEAIKKASQINGVYQSVVIEQKIFGMEFSCIVLIDNETGQKVSLMPTEIVLEAQKKFYDYEQKYMPGRALLYTPARVSQSLIAKIQLTCIRVMEILEFETIARIDGFLRDDGSIIIFDPNSLSGMAPSSFLFRQAACHGMSHADLINHLIQSELLWSKKKEGLLMKQKSKVGVIFGGASHEREISLESGRNVIYKLQSSLIYEPIALFLSSKLLLYAIDDATLVCHATAEIEAVLSTMKPVLWSDLVLQVDFVFIALHGGVGENGSLQGALEMLQIPYNGSGVLTSSLCMNKYKTNQFLHSQGFTVPKNMLIERVSYTENSIENLEHAIPYPLIVKPHDDGCSILVQKVSDQKELHEALKNIWNDGKECALVEECIVGMELTVGILGNESAHALPPSYCVTNDSILTIQEKFLPGAGENQTPAPLSQRATEFVQKIIEAVFHAIEGSGYARIDCFYQDEKANPTKKERLVILEINTLPGLTPATCIFHQAGEIGMRPLDFIEKIIDFGFQNHRHMKKEKVVSEINFCKNQPQISSH